MATTDQALLSRLQNRLVEPPNGGASWESGLWSRDEVISLVNLRQDRFLFDTLCEAGTANIAGVASQSKYNLPSDWLRTVGIVWQGTDGTVREIMRSNSFEADHLVSTWESTAASYPLVYFEEETETATLQLAPAPSGTGTIIILYVPLGTELNGNGEILVLPDDLAHALEYGALADLLGKDGRGADPSRAAYCEQRFSLAEAAVQIILKGWA